MRTIIAGSREFHNYEELEKAIKLSGFSITVVLSGMARGVDALGVQYAEQNHLPLEKYPADWERYGKGAGHKRNAIMAKNAEALIALWNSWSPGTYNMIQIAKALKLQVFVHRIEV